MGFSVSLVTNDWESIARIVTVIASVAAAIGSIFIVITYRQIKKQFKHELAKEDEKRRIDYRLLVLEHLGPLNSFFLKEHQKPEIMKLLSQKKIISGGDDIIENDEGLRNLTDFYREQNERIRLFLAKILEYPFIQADFPVSYRLMFNTVAVIDGLVGCIETHHGWKFSERIEYIGQLTEYNELFSRLLGYSLGFVVEQLNIIIGSSQDSLWDLHLKELELRNDFPYISEKVLLNHDNYIKQLNLYSKHYDINPDTAERVSGLIRRITDIKMIKFQSTMPDDTSPGSLSNLR